MKRRILALMLAAALVLSLAGCRKRPKTKYSEQTAEIASRLLTDWNAYLTEATLYYGDMLWTLSYAERFLKEQSWESLQRARMVLELANRYRQAHTPPEPSVRADELDLLVREGRDVDYALTEIRQFSLLMTMDDSSYAMVRRELNEKAFSKSAMDTFARFLGNQRALTQSRLEQLALSTAYLFSQFGETESVQRLRSQIAANLPEIHAYLPVADATAETIFSMSSNAYDAYDALVDEFEALAGEMNVNRNNLLDAQGTKDDTWREADRFEISGLPLVLPMPTWMLIGDVEYKYYPVDANGSLFAPQEGAEIDCAPVFVHISVPDTSKEAVRDYVDDLERQGYPNIGVNEDNAVFKAYYVLGDYSFVVAWEDGAASIIMPDNPPCLAPFWYFS